MEAGFGLFDFSDRQGVHSHCDGIRKKGIRVPEGWQATLGIFISVGKEGGYKGPKRRNSKFSVFMHQLSHLLESAGRLPRQMLGLQRRTGHSSPREARRLGERGTKAKTNIVPF